MSTDTKLVEYRPRVDVDITADVSIKVKEATEILSGTYKAKAKSLDNVRYPYSVNEDSDGVEHYIMGPETTTCELIEVPEVSFDLQHSNVVAKDPDAVSRKADYLRRVTENKQNPVCAIIIEAYKHFFVQMRAFTNVLPKSAFFKDI